MKRPAPDKPKVTWTPRKVRATHVIMGITDDGLRMVRGNELGIYMWMN